MKIMEVKINDQLKVKESTSDQQLHLNVTSSLTVMDSLRKGPLTVIEMDQEGYLDIKVRVSSGIVYWLASGWLEPYKKEEQL